MERELTRRGLVAWAAALGGAAAATGLVEATPAAALPAQGEGERDEQGEWKSAACPFNCSYGSSRCLLRTYVVDGVPRYIRTDESGEDTPINPQRRACPRGRAMISNMLSADRVKYPMKRKGWSPDEPNGDMRGRDEWERIGWDEALDIFASQVKKCLDEYGPDSIFQPVTDIPASCHYFDPTLYALYNLGSGINNKWGTVSGGSWYLADLFISGGMAGSPDPLAARESDLHIYFGCNWAANKGGNNAYQMATARGDTGKIIIVDPWLNQTAEALADEWVPVRPGTDTALLIGMAYHMIENNLQNQEFLDTYCVGFDADHMPEGAQDGENFRDYCLGNYDGVPKTPEWAEAICGVPAERICSLAEEIAGTEKVAFWAGNSTSKIPAGEMFVQAFYTLACMHGVGTPGNTVAWMQYSQTHFSPGDWANVAENPVNPVKPPTLVSSPAFFVPDDWEKQEWNQLEYSETWQSILAGEYGRDSWPCGKKPIDFHMIYAGGGENPLNSTPNVNLGIQVFRSMDFVVAVNPWFCPTARYADLVLPAATWWEKGDRIYLGSGNAIFWDQQVMDPIYEARSEREIARGLAERLGLAPESVDTASTERRMYQAVSGTLYKAEDGTFQPLVTLTQDDLDELGYPEGQTQEGIISMGEFRERGMYHLTREDGDAYTVHPYQAFIEDPVANPLGTASGKFELCCQTLASVVNGYGFSTISPIAKWQIGDPEQGQGTQTEEYPLLLWTPHSLRRAHTIGDSVTSLREGFPQPCYMSTVDAEKLGIENGDLVLMTSPHGRVLRHAKVMPTVVPGAVALEDGAWIDIDEETGIDLGGDPNVLQAPKASGQGVQCWSGTLVRVERYEGDLTLDYDKYRDLVLPVGVE